jgi:hypothetical protein
LYRLRKHDLFKQIEVPFSGRESISHSIYSPVRKIDPVTKLILHLLKTVIPGQRPPEKIVYPGTCVLKKMRLEWRCKNFWMTFKEVPN